MFFVFDRKKISSYLISLGMVVILFTVSVMVTNNVNNTVETSTKIQEHKNNNIESENKEVSSSINSNKSAENINNNIHK